MVKWRPWRWYLIKDGLRRRVTARNQRLTAFWDMRGWQGSRLFFLHYCFGMATNSHLKQTLKSFRASCVDAKPTIYRRCRRSGDKIDALKHGIWKLILTLRTEYLITSDSRWKKGYTCRDVSFLLIKSLKTVLYHPEYNYFLKVGFKSNSQWDTF